MSTVIEFKSFPKLSRITRDCVISEKLDGTNAAVVITEDGSIAAQSRTRLITPEADNYGFARWVKDHEAELLALGPGHHFGEWWGAGIQRRYGLTEKRFSLFNTARWSETDSRPACCHVVPELFRGTFCTEAVAGTLEKLGREGSVAAPGFMQPEGIVIYHVAANVLFKKTLGDDGHKGIKCP